MQSNNEEVVYLYLDDIIPNRFQPREVFDEKPLKELAVSIKEHGVIQPIIVRKVNDKYEIIAGERRYKASALAGLTKIPAIIRDLDDKESSKVALLENLQRKNLNPIEEAKTYQKILELDEMTQEDLAKTMGKSQSAVANKLRLLSLPEEVKDALMKDKISERHARALLNLEDAKEQTDLLKEIIDNKMTVKQVEEKIKGVPSNNVEELEQTEMQNAQKIPGQDQYIANSPLIPSFLTNREETKNEPILITPGGENAMQLSNENSTPSMANSESEQDASDTNKFINFGEIDDSEDESEELTDDLEDTNEEINFGPTLPTTNTIDLQQIKANAEDISSINTDNPSNANLDNLLQINTPSINLVNEGESSPNQGFKFFSPAQEALENSEKVEEPSVNDYFQAPELIHVDLPPEVNQNSPTNSVNLSSIDANLEVNNHEKEDNPNDLLNDYINKIRDLVKEIEQKGLKVDLDELSLEKSYQVIIKIEK